MRNTFFTSFPKEIAFASIFAVITLLALSLFFLPQQSTKEIQQKVAGVSDKKSSSPTITQISFPTPTIREQQSEKTETSQTQTIQITVIVTPTPQSQIQENKATIHVSITGTSSFDITMDKGKTQCDVLTQAKNEGKITQLLMKYDANLDSYGLYQINNLGKDNAVWWTYEVNSKAPNMGCNHVAANNGDIVSWKYIGN